jgi:hypoxanthine-DNA glycosylase
MSRIHCLPPFNAEKSKYIILGTMPSETSLEKKLYYGNPKNNFWDILSRCLKNKIDFFEPFNHSTDIFMMYNLLEDKSIGIWDVLESCTREGNRDIKIKDEKLNDFELFLTMNPNIKHVIFNGQPAEQFFKNKYPDYKNAYSSIQFRILNSTSIQNPNNAFRIFERMEKCDRRDNC